MLVNRQNADNWSLLFVFYTQFIVLGLLLLLTNLMVHFFDKAFVCSMKEISKLAKVLLSAAGQKCTNFV